MPESRYRHGALSRASPAPPRSPPSPRPPALTASGRWSSHPDVPLFDRRRRGVRLNRRGRACLKEVQRILAEVHGVSERQRR